MGRILSELWNIREIVIMFITPILLLPLPLCMDTQESKAAYVLLLMAVLWVSEAVPISVTSLLPMFLFPMMGIVKAKDIAPAYMSDTLMVFIGGLIMAAAIEVWNIHKLLALRTLLLVGSEPKWLMLGLMLPTWFLSMFISNTATTAIMIPIAQAILVELQQAKQSLLEVKEEYINTDYEKGGKEEEMVVFGSSSKTEGEKEDVKYKKLCKAVSLCICYAANCGGIGALTGTGPNLVVKGFADELYASHGAKSPITYATWMGFGLPLSFLVLFITWIWLQLFFLGFKNTFSRGSKTKKEGNDEKVKNLIRKQYEALGHITFAQKSVIIVFSVLVLCWITRDLGGIGGWSSLFRQYHVKDSTPAMLASVLMFFLPSELPGLFKLKSKPRDVSKRRIRPLLVWSEAHEKLPWGLFLLLGGGFALAKGCHLSGLSELIGIQLKLFSGLNKWLMLLILCYVSQMLTQFISNVALATLVIPILSNLALLTGVHPLFYILPAAVATSFAYMLPVATAPNALCFAYGHIRVMDMVTAGLFLNVVTVPVLVFATYTWGDAIFNFSYIPLIFQYSNSTQSFNITQ